MKTRLFSAIAMRLLCAGLMLVACLGGSASAQDSLAGITERLARPDVLRGEFSQEKRLAGFRNPLRSSGSFLLVRERGIVWRTLAPFPSTTVVTSDRILSRQPDGSSRVELDAKQQPALGAVNALLFALFAGDIAALSDRFEAAAAVPDDTHWTLELTPKPGALDDIFVRIVLSGDSYVRHVRIAERGGDITEISFAALVDAPAALTDEEARQFE